MYGGKGSTNSSPLSNVVKLLNVRSGDLALPTLDEDENTSLPKPRYGHVMVADRSHFLVLGGSLIEEQGYASTRIYELEVKGGVGEIKVETGNEEERESNDLLFLDQSSLLQDQSTGNLNSLFTTSTGGSSPSSPIDLKQHSLTTASSHPPQSYPHLKASLRRPLSSKMLNKPTLPTSPSRTPPGSGRFSSSSGKEISLCSSSSTASLLNPSNSCKDIFSSSPNLFQGVTIHNARSIAQSNMFGVKKWAKNPSKKYFQLVRSGQMSLET